MATKTAKIMQEGALSATITTTLYTAPAIAAPSAIVKEITLANTNTTTARIVTVDFGANKTLLPAITLEPKEVRIIHLSKVLGNAQTIRGGQSSGTDVEATISGIEYS